MLHVLFAIYAGVGGFLTLLSILALIVLFAVMVYYFLHLTARASFNFWYRRLRRATHT